LSNEVISNVNVFCSRVLNRMFGNVDSTHVVTEDCHGFLTDVINHLASASSKAAECSYKITIDIEATFQSALLIIVIFRLISIKILWKFFVLLFKFLIFDVFLSPKLMEDGLYDFMIYEM
ncbi:Hypothetical predicted protein, partial [Olea europaea subsp. europaea]